MDLDKKKEKFGQKPYINPSSQVKWFSMSWESKAL